jgi:hypothetical protein
MNPWTGLLDPAALLPKGEQPAGRVHVLADEIDKSSMQPASKPGPKPSVHLPPPASVPTATPAPVPADASIRRDAGAASIPRKVTPPANPGPRAYRVPAPTPKPAMTYAEAIKVRARHRNRQPVMAAELIEANRVVQETRHRAIPPEESYE